MAVVVSFMRPWMGLFICMCLTVAHPVISTFANGMEDWDVEVTNCNNDSFMLCTGGNETKNEETTIVESSICLVHV